MSHEEKLARLVAAACGECEGGGAAEAARVASQEPELVAGSIHAASALGEAPAVARLLAADPSLAMTRMDPRGWDPLLCAAFSRVGEGDRDRKAGLAAAARLLLEHGADPNTSFPLSASPEGPRAPALLGAAAVGDNLELVRLLLDAGARPNDGETLFHAAAKERYACLELLLARGGDLNDRGHPAGNTPLAWVLDWEYRPAVVTWLLDHGADPDAPSGPHGETALHVAVRRRRADAVGLLLDRGAAIDARTNGGKTAYAHATRRGFHEVAELLASRGADPALTSVDHLAAALMGDDLEAARSLVAAEPDLVRSFDAEDARLLADVAGSDRAEAVELLLDAGADIAARGLDGGTPLHQAAWFGAPAAARVLIDRGAPLEIRGDDHDSTPLGWVAHGSRFSGGAGARGEVYARIAGMLLEAGASLADPADPQGDPHGRWLLCDASEPVAAVLERHGARR